MENNDYWHKRGQHTNKDGTQTVYYHCTYRDTQNCMARRIVYISADKFTLAEDIRAKHTCIPKRPKQIISNVKNQVLDTLKSGNSVQRVVLLFYFFKLILLVYGPNN